MKINWKQKLSSRKFWIALVSVVSSILVAFKVPDMTVEQVVVCITGIGSLVAYIVTEGVVDKARAKSESKPTDKSEEEKS